MDLLHVCVMGLLLLVQDLFALKIVEVSIPKVVSSGTTVILGCQWTLDEEGILYSVKWYRNHNEFFRYIPKELPHFKFFDTEGIDVDLSLSNDHEVALRNVTRNLTGQYGCEVSEDAPSFYTQVFWKYMHVVDLPESPPVLEIEKLWYSEGDILKAYCSAPPADPPAELSWMINGKTVDTTLLESVPSSTDETNGVISFQNRSSETLSTKISELPTKNPRTSWKRHSSVASLNLRLLAKHFLDEKLNLTCVSSVHTIYSAADSVTLNEEKPQLALILGKRDSFQGEDIIMSKAVVQSSGISIVIIMIVIQLQFWFH